MTEEITVRPVTRSDLPALVALEKAVWTSLGTPVLGYQELKQWYDQGSPFFLVAECGTEACGYYFGHQMHFALEAWRTHLDPKHMNGKGWSEHEHSPEGNGVYGINTVSVKPGSGNALNAEVHRLLRELVIRYFFGFTRIARFDRYLQRVSAEVAALPDTLDRIALWYAHESAQKLRMRTWDVADDKPEITLPRLTLPDPVLAFHVRGRAFGLLGTTPNYIVPDPESRGYGAFVLSETPHV